MTEIPTAAAGPDGGHVFSVSEARYFAPITNSDSFHLHAHDSSLASVFALPQVEKPRVTADWLRALVQEYENTDDVFDKAFLATVVFHGAVADDVEFTSDAREYLLKLGNEQVVFVTLPDLLPGPYLVIGGKLRDVWKLVDDSNGTCMTTLKPQSNPSDAFESFQVCGVDSQFPSFALRSRIKTRAAFKSPLAGLRILVKDNIHLKGTKTSVGNRAFYNTYPPRQESAQCIQKLVDQGVVVAGKTKMNSFGNWEEPLEYIDYQAPWNPRGDRYQSPGGSSSGSAVAVAAYDWLDLAIGTDTWASVTRPALWCGCFGLRPTFGAVSAHGVEPYCQKWDTVGILARDLQKCRDFAAEWLDTNVLDKETKPFSAVIWPTDYWSIIDPAQTAAARDFAKTTTKILGVAFEEVSFEALWAKFSPPEAHGLSLGEFINKATMAQCYDAYHNCDDFVKKHREQFGRAPYISPPNQRMWNFAKTLSKEDRDGYFAKIDIYEGWFRDTVLSGQNSNALIIMPLESMTPRYRDQSPTFKRPPQDGINALALAPVMKSPVLAVPISEVSYDSSITGQTENLPLVVAVMGMPGTDLALMDTMHMILRKAKLPTTVKTGKRMYG